MLFCKLFQLNLLAVLLYFKPLNVFNVSLNKSFAVGVIYIDCYIFGFLQ
jgi:hypothetical protein